jgi:RNA polymerase sigma-70 factor (ECF subfamily)
VRGLTKKRRIIARFAYHGRVAQRDAVDGSPEAPTPIHDAEMASAAAEHEAARRLLFEAGARAWPTLRLSPEAFRRHLVSRAFAGGLQGPVHAADFFLTSACLEGVRGAVEAFDRAYLGQLAAFLSPLHPSPDLIDEVGQVLREKLLMSKLGRAPRLAEYDGRAALTTWLRVIARRAAIDLLRQRSAGAARLDEPPPDAATADTEGDHVKRWGRQPFNDALRRSIAGAPPDQREILRLHFAEGLTLDELAVSLGVHRATVARRLAAARHAIHRETRRLLGAELGLTPAELDSLTRLMRSQLDLSLSGLGKSDPPRGR